MLKGAIECNEEECYNRWDAGETIENRVKDAKEATESFNDVYPEIKKEVEGKVVLDVGGAAGIDYFRTGKKSRLWFVLENENAYKRYDDLMSEAGLFFNSINYPSREVIDMPSREKVLHLRGSLQYLEQPIHFLEVASHQVDTIILCAIPTSDKQFKTCQVGVGLSWVFRSKDIYDALPDFEMTYSRAVPYPYDTDLPQGYKVHNLDFWIFKRKIHHKV